MMDNNWKNYEVKPDEGLFDAVHRHLRLRRALRIGGVAVAVIAVAVVAIWSLNRGTANDAVETQQVAIVPVVNQPVADETITDAIVADSPANVTAKADSKLMADGLYILPETQSALPKVNEPVYDNLFDESLFAELTTTPVNPIPETPKTTAEPDSMITGQLQADSHESVSSTKVGGPAPVPYQVDNILWAPNIITPNGDVAENRVFKVVATSDVSDFRIHIYNRGGRLLFKSSDINEVWDATHNGTSVPQGAYVWVATFRGTDGSSHREAGTVTVVW